MPHVLAQDLRNAVLQAAFQGKLTNRLETDSNVLTLIKEVEIEKTTLVKLGKVEKPKKLSPIVDEELPFDIPDTWIWERWGNLSNSIQYGANAGATTNGNARLVRISDIQNNGVVWQSVPFCEVKDNDIEQYLLNENDILFARTGGTVGKSVIVKNIPDDGNKYIFAGYLIRSNYSSKINYQYLKYFMDSKLYWDQLKAGTIGSAQPNCNGKTLSKMIIPLPPIEEQARIVARVDELMAKIDEYEKIEKELISLHKAFPGNMKDAILQAAFEGKLTHHDSEDSDVHSYVQNVLNKQAMLIKEKKIKVGKYSKEYDEDLPDLPENWCYVKMGDISSLVTKQTGFDYSKTIKPSLMEKKRDGAVPYIQTRDFSHKDFNFDTKFYAPKEIVDKYPNITLRGKHLLLSIVGSIGNIGIYDFETTCLLGGAITKIDLLDDALYDYLYYYLQSPLGQREISKNKHQTAQATVTVEDMRSIAIPLPSIEEQHRIVEKLDQILPLCERLETIV